MSIEGTFTIQPARNWTFFKTRMHSSRMRTVGCSGHLLGGGGMSAWGCLPGGLPRGWTPPPCGQTDTCENITFPQLLLRMVKIGGQSVLLLIPLFGLLVMSALDFKAREDPSFYASSPACNGFLRFTSGVTPANLLTAEQPSLFDPHTWTHTSIEVTRTVCSLRHSDCAVQNYN